MPAQAGLPRSGGEYVERRGEPGSLEGEELTAGRQPPGRYRILVHNWAGAPQQVDVVITFFNENDEPGAGATGSGAGMTEDYLLTLRSPAYLPQP